LNFKGSDPFSDSLKGASTMIDQETVKLLASHPFLHGLSQPLLEKMASITQRITVTAGQYLGHEKEQANAFYLIQSGRVAIEFHAPERESVRIQTIGPGEIVGWSWLVPPHRWQFDARVSETLQALALDARSLRAQCEQDHELGYQLLKHLVEVISGRLAATRLQLLDVSR
jgi:CRP-like cAMP-binding protein